MVAEFDTSTLSEPVAAAPGLARALREVFWRRGYEEASVEDLVKATGRNRYALYNAYGGKREMFLAALEDYYLERKSVFLRHLEDPDGAPLTAIREVVQFAITEMAERGEGCLMGNVASDVAKIDAVIAERVEAYLEDIRCAYVHALERARTRAELNPGVDPQRGAALLLAVQLGIGARARHGDGLAELLAIFETAMAGLCAPTTRAPIS